MKPEPPHLLILNGGSSSIKFALYPAHEPLHRGLSGTLDRIGLDQPTFSIRDPADPPAARTTTPIPVGGSPTTFLLDWIENQHGAEALQAVGHRVVHGGQHTQPERITPELLADLHQLSPCDPEHLPSEIALIEAVQRRWPQLPQVACFDTAFHQTLPRVARLLPLPRRYDRQGIRRYGFHGLSYANLLEELARLGDPTASVGRVILAHLGNGASLAAVKNGRSIDTTMGFTPTAGLVMSTRTGDLDPGLVSYLARTENMTAAQFHQMINRESGLLGISETSSDMRDLLAREATDIRAAEAVALFCYQAKKWTGAFAAALGGLDTLVFAGGIGENAAPVRARICDGLGFLGLELSESRNAAGAPVISTDTSRVTIRILHTDEERMIARAVMQILRCGAGTGSPPEPFVVDSTLPARG